MICYGTLHVAYASCFGSGISRFPTLLSLLVPVKEAVFGRGGAPCTIIILYGCHMFVEPTVMVRAVKWGVLE